LGSVSKTSLIMASIKVWISAFRLRTLPLALSATILGSFLAYDNNTFKWAVLILGIITTLCLQILSNLANDYGDAQKGTDNEKRLGPQRLTQAGIVTRRHMRGMILLFVILSLLSGCSLIYFGLKDTGSYLSLLFFLLGIAAIVAAIKYTVGKKPYGYTGLGDIMVFLFFGLLGVGGTYFLHGLSFEWAILMPASAIGLFSAGVLNLNNLRDRENDKENGKMTLVVKLGLRRAKIYHGSLLTTGFLISLLYTLTHYNSPYQFLFLLTLPMLISGVMKVLKNTVAMELNSELRKLAIATLIFALTFGIGLIL